MNNRPMRPYTEREAKRILIGLVIFLAFVLAIAYREFGWVTALLMAIGGTGLLAVMALLLGRNLEG